MAIKLEVRSKGPNGFRRGGQFFGPDPREIEVEDEQADAIMREKQLFVRRLDGGAMPSGSAPNAEPPFASGLSDGSRFVPSDKSGGKPEGDDAAKAGKQQERRATQTAPTQPEVPAQTGDDETRRRR